MRTSLLLRILLLSGVLVSLSGCGLYDRWFGGSEEPPLPGDRIAVLRSDSVIEADPRLAGVPIVLPAPIDNSDWPQPGGTPDHAIGHVALGEGTRRQWTANVGAGSDRNHRMLSPPVVAAGRVYAMDARCRVTAVDAENGERVWSVDLTSERGKGGFGGGVAFAGGILFAATGCGQVVALDAARGEEIWRRDARAPSRGAPTIYDGKVFVTTLDNRLEAIDARTGEPLWTHTGMAEIAGILGSASPAGGGGLVIVPYSSGELFALRADNGRMVWGDSLAAVRRSDVVSELADIRGLPVLYQGLVIAASHSGRAAGIDARSGNRVWDQDYGSINMPWVAGEFFYLVTTDNQLIAAQIADGRVRWARSMQAFRNPERREDRVVWAGPILAGGRLVLVSSLGQAVFLSPQTGEELGRIDLPARTVIPPVVAGRTLYILSDNGTLSAYR